MAQQGKKISISDVLVMAGLLVMVVMAVMPLLNLNQQWMRWLFAAGALSVVVGRCAGLYRGPSLRIRRLHHLLVISGLLYCGSAWMMLVSRNTNDWIAFLLAGVVMQIYASSMIDHEQKKSDKKS